MTPAAEPVRPLRTGLQLLWPLAWTLGALLALVAALLSLAGWLLGNEDGTRWLLKHAPLVQAEGVRGTLLGPQLQADRVRVSWSDGRASVTIRDLRLQGLALAWHPTPGVWLGVQADTTTATEVVVNSGPPSGQPLHLPTTLALPLRVDVAQLQVQRLVVDRLPAFETVQGRVALGLGGFHRADGVSFVWDRVRVAGAVQLDQAAPFGLAGNLRVQPRFAPAQPSADFNAALRVRGNLSRLEATAQVRGVAQRQKAAPTADLQATLAPFAAWPLLALKGHTQALDLAVFSSAAPNTSLSGDIDVATSARDAPLQVQLLLANTLAGRWNEGRLPLRQLQLQLQAHPTQRERVDLQSLTLTLSDGGRWTGQGQWLAHTLKLDTQLQGLRPQLIDGRAPAMHLTGPLAFTLAGLPSPANGAAAPQPEASAPAAKAPGRAATPAAPAADSPPAWPWALTLKTTLEGRLDAAPLPVQLQLDASADARHLDLRQLRARTGDALAEAQLDARAVGAGWAVNSSGSVSNLDPTVWWPGEPGSAWRQGQHRLNGLWTLDLRLPPGARSLAPVALAQRIAGSGTLRVHDSVLAGVPVGLELLLGQTRGRQGTPGTLQGGLLVGGNALNLNGQGEPLGQGLDDQVTLNLQAPRLAEIAPLLRLLPGLQAWAPSNGQATATATVRGRWPELRTEGQVAVKQWQSPQLGLALAEARWLLDSGGQAQQPLELHAQVQGARLSNQRLEKANVDLKGTWREHQLDISAAFGLTPPPWAETALGVRAGVGTLARMQGAGAWEADAAGGGTWRGRVQHLAVGAWDGKNLQGETTATGWLDARDLRAEVALGAGGKLQRVQAAPGRVKLADTAVLRWDEVQIDLRPQRPDIELNAEISPFPAAPLLARAQPAMGWGGDLRLAAKVQVKAAEKFDADIVFQRHDGDLTVRDDAGLQLLGLSDLRVAVNAHEGQWFFTHGLAGRTLGEMAGAVRVVTAPQNRWPQPEDPLDGVVQANVANLGVWGAWVPPGWRLGGQMALSASVGGRFGAPEYTGTLEGKDLAVRNLLQGVNIGQGTVAVQLNGDAATVQQFSFKAGDGQLKLTGGASFGSQPVAKLRLEAERFRLLGRIDRQLVVSGQSDLQFQSDLFKLDGKLNIDEGLFDTSRGDAPGLDEDVSVRRSSTEDTGSEAAPTQRQRRNLAVVVDVDLGEKLRVKGRGLDTTLQGQLRLTTPGGRLQVNGNVSTENGTYAAYGQKLAIDRGIVAFSGAPDNPRLDILALRPNLDTRVGVAITGNVQTPRVRLYAETDMSDTDKLSWLVMGRASDGLGRTDTALLQRAAVALLSGEGEAPTDQVLKTLGIDELSLRQSEGDVRETVISLGKQLSRRWYVGYERGVNATTGTWQLVYRIAQRFTLRAQSGLENSLDVIWVWKLDDALAIPGVTKSAPKPP